MDWADSCKTRRESVKFCDLVQLILEILRYFFCFRKRSQIRCSQTPSGWWSSPKMTSTRSPITKHAGTWTCGEQWGKQPCIYWSCTTHRRPWTLPKLCWKNSQALPGIITRQMSTMVSLFVVFVAWDYYEQMSTMVSTFVVFVAWDY